MKSLAKTLNMLWIGLYKLRASLSRFFKDLSWIGAVAFSVEGIYIFFY